MKGRITYTTTLASTPVQSPLTVADISLLDDISVDTILAGATQDIYLYWGYKDLDPDYNDQRSLSQSASGVAQITNFLSTKGFTFSVYNVLQDRAQQVNEYAVLESLNEELMNGVVVSWYPDYDNFPAEYYSCVARKRLKQKRIGVMFKYQFDFDLMILAAVQVPSTVPDFVLA